MSSPWGKINQPKPMNLKDIMMEEAAKHQKYNKPISPLLESHSITKMIQEQYDDSCEEDSDELEHICDYKEWKRFDNIVKERTHDQINIAGVPFSQPISARPSIHNRTQHLKAEMELSEYSQFMINNLIKKKLFNSINGVVNIGEESVILHADSDPSYNKIKLPKELAIKVFNINHPECKLNDKCCKLNIIHASARIELINLKIYKKAGIPCPDAIAYKPRVLVMSFIGNNHIPAPKLKNIQEEEDFIAAYWQVVNAMKMLYTKFNLIHTDISDNNILWHNNTCYFIDIKQLIEISQENAFIYLIDACDRISKFFKKHVKTLGCGEDIFLEVVGCNFGDKIKLEKIQESIKMKSNANVVL